MKNIFIKIAFILFLALGSIVSSAQQFNWAISMGGYDDDVAQDIAVDRSGNVFITGSFIDSADFNPGSGVDMIKSAGGNDVFVAKYDSNGNYVWAKSMGSIDYDYGNGVAVDSKGNVYVTGYWGNLFGSSTTIDFNPGGSGGVLTCMGQLDGFLAKYDPDGHFLWAKDIGGPRADYGYGVAVDNSDNVYVTGSFMFKGDFNSGSNIDTLTSIGGSQDVFVVKYDANGNYLWGTSTGGSALDQGHSIAIGTNNDIYVTGSYRSADFKSDNNGSTLTNKGNADIFLAKYDGSGNYLWAIGMGGIKGDDGDGVAVDRSGNAYVTGHFYDSVDFDPGANTAFLVAVRYCDIFVAKYDPTGNYMWAGSMKGNSADDYGTDLVIDQSSHLYVTGYFKGSVDFDPGTKLALLNPGSNTIYDAFIAKYDACGNYIWAKNVGGSDFDYGYGIAVNGQGSVYLSGQFGGTADFDLGPDSSLRNSAGNEDAFILKIHFNDTLTYITVSTCEQSYTWNDSVYTASGIYTQSFPDATGCSDSLVTLNLTITPVTKPTINIDSFTLGVAGTYVTYQWIENGVPIPGAISSTYTVTENGNYQVAVTNENGCADTSEVYKITNYTAIHPVDILKQQITIYPNPATNMIHIQSPVKVNVTLTDLQGRIVCKMKNAHSLSLTNLTESIYLLQISNVDNVRIKVEKIIKLKP